VIVTGVRSDLAHRLVLVVGRDLQVASDTLDEHRQAVRDATLDATAALVTERGLYGVTMSEVAIRTGIGRATLYKYFPDVQSILIARHERAIATHLRQLTALANADGQPMQRLTAVLEAYAAIEHAHGDHPLAPLGAAAEASSVATVVSLTLAALRR
jgi:AcrR family transcriptional regulator